MRRKIERLEADLHAMEENVDHANQRIEAEGLEIHRQLQDELEIKDAEIHLLRELLQQ